MLKNIFATAVVFLSACVDDGVGGMPGSLPTDDTADVDPTGSGVPRQLDQVNQPAPCEMVTDTDGACAHACDPDALVAYIPKGTCAAFTCPLADGTQYITGGCN